MTDDSEHQTSRFNSLHPPPVACIRCQSTPPDNGRGIGRDTASKPTLFLQVLIITSDKKRKKEKSVHHSITGDDMNTKIRQRHSLSIQEEDEKRPINLQASFNDPSSEQ